MAPNSTAQVMDKLCPAAHFGTPVPFSSPVRLGVCGAYDMIYDGPNKSPSEIGRMCARRVAGDEEEDKRARSELKELSRQRAQRVPVARPPTAVVEEVEAEVEAGGGVPVRRVVA